ncbi:MAG: GNAT family N-acetyltransferase [Hyphomicrobiaceae bacterium]|nr:GNAT family N-acetyltransferase [Hyphomicrobiaceae bacterium]
MNARDFSIREAERDDAETLAELMRALHAHLKEPTEHISADALRRDIFTADSVHTVLVAERAGELIGYALFHETYESIYAQRGAYMADLYVAETARRQGVARALVAAVASAARARRLRFLWWVSESWDENAQRFYAALGASHEPYVAHAVSFETFDALAEEGDKRDGARPSK